MRHLSIKILILLSVGGVMLACDPSSPIRKFYQPPDIDAVRSRLQTSTEAGRALQTTIDQLKQTEADFIALSREEIRRLIPPAETKRSMMVHRQGCPLCGGGTQVFAPFGKTIDLKKPLQATCQICSHVFPDEHFPDTGQGWIDDRPNSPTKGERYYFVGWFAHWMWTLVGQHTYNLATLWALTGDPMYAEKARFLLERVAEVYADLKGEDLSYDGTEKWTGVYVKMTGTYWEGPILTDLAKGIEILLPTLSDSLLEQIHTRVYRAAFAAYRAKPATGNWGNLWNPALFKFATLLNDQEMYDFARNGHPAALEPVLDNQFFRDGFPYEASLGYASTYIYVALSVADALGKRSDWIWEHPHFRNTFPGFADLMILDRFTHFAADMGSPKNTGWALSPVQIAEAYRHHPTPQLARYLLQSRVISREDPYLKFSDIFNPPLETQAIEKFAQQAPPEQNVLMPARGFAILRTGQGAERQALILDYGYAHITHHHADRLNINFFKYDRDFIIEMGYPEYMDDVAPATGGWTTHTVTHATVEVDEHRQTVSVFGDLQAFVGLPGLQMVDAECADAYHYRGVQRYRRTLLLVDTPDLAYVLDVFRVKGGRRHDYLFHGPALPVQIEGVRLSSPAPGTLASPALAFGATPPGVIRPHDPTNSGYQYLYAVQQAPLTQIVQLTWEYADSVCFRATVLPISGEKLILTQGYPRPSSKELPPMPFLLRRVDHPESNDGSQFITVISADKATPAINHAERVPISGSEGAVAVRISYPQGEDLILANLEPTGQLQAQDGAFAFEGLLAIVQRRTGKNQTVRLIGAQKLRLEGQEFDGSPAEFTSRITAVNDLEMTLTTALPDWAIGKYLQIDRGLARVTYRCEGMTGKRVRISPTCWIGKGIVSEVQPDSGLVQDDRDIFPLGNPSEPAGARNYYTGAWLTNARKDRWYRISHSNKGSFYLTQETDWAHLAQDFKKGETFWLYDIGPGDKVRLLNVREFKIGK